MTSIDTILESVGINRQDLTTQVDEHRRMSGEMRLVLASHFPVEDLACAVEQLAARLTAISDEMTHNLGDYYVGGLAEDVIDMVNDADRKDVLEIMRLHLDLPTADGQGSAPILNTVPIFGYPDLKCVTHTVLNHAVRTFDHASYLVNVNTGEVSTVPPEQTAVQTAALLAQGASNV
ncbi:hypothetical protein [Arthrobacter sp. UYCo732]|uniref:hypothetical protein n=1 Tax=Arthrobacter sp. UYCo732 TaxID=3156336 RepID=UPI003390C5AB